jgi:hypothetical protein
MDTWLHNATSNTALLDASGPQNVQPSLIDVGLIAGVAGAASALVTMYVFKTWGNRHVTQPSLLA